MAEKRLSELADRLEKVASKLENISIKGKAGGGAAANENTEIVEEFDKVIGGKFKEYFELSDKIGGDVKTHAGLARQCFDACRSVVVLASKHKRPTPDVFQKVVKTTGDAVSSVQGFAEKNRGSKQYNHLATVKDGIGCVGWVTVSPKPGQYLKETYDQSLFYGNRVLKEYKDKDKTHVTWMRSFTDGIKELREYVQSYHATGLLWNAEGTDLTGVPSAGAPPPPPPGAGGPPPPPPPAVQPPSDVPSKPAPAGDRPDPTALFASINKGSDITSGLKKVTNDMKTHKNPELRASSVVKAGDVKKPKAAAAPKTTVAAAKKPPVCELRGQKWIVENQEDNSNLTINITDPKLAVFVYKCSKCTIKVSNKCNSILIDSCKRVGLVFDGVISAMEVINSQSVQVQVIGQCPTVSIDKTDGCQVYLSKDSIEAEIITAKSSEMNISIPIGDEGEFTERAVPEQFRTRWDGKKLVTECTDING